MPTQLMEPMKNKGDTKMKRVYEKTYNRLEARGLKPTMNILDNEASSLICTYLTNSKVNYQKVPPHCHQANAAERATERGKHHLIAGLSSLDEEFPMNQWDKLIPQGEESLNMLRLT